MKSFNLLSTLLAGVSAVSAAALPSAIDAREVADGFYQVSTDDSGNTKTTFKPWDEVVTTSVRERSPLEKRREDCGPGSVSTGEADDANTCLINGFSGDNVYLEKNAWSYVSFPLLLPPMVFP